MIRQTISRIPTKVARPRGRPRLSNAGVKATGTNLMTPSKSMKSMARALNTYPIQRAGFEMTAEEVVDSITRFLLQEYYSTCKLQVTLPLYSFWTLRNRKGP